jgi:hypothetical protein
VRTAAVFRIEPPAQARLTLIKAEGILKVFTPQVNGTAGCLRHVGFGGGRNACHPAARQRWRMAGGGGRWQWKSKWSRFLWRRAAKTMEIYAGRQPVIHHAMKRIKQ